MSSFTDDSKASEVRKNSHTWKINWALFLSIFYIAMGSIFYTLLSVFVKNLNYIDTGELSLIRNIGSFAFGLPISVYSVKEMFGPKEHRLLMIGRGFLGATSLYLGFLSYRHLPLAEAAILMSTTPIMVFITARLYLKETCDFIKTCCLVITIIGVLVSIRVPELLKNRDEVSFDLQYVMGVLCAVGNVIFMSLSIVTARKLKDVHFSVFLIYYGSVGIVENGMIVSIFSSYSVPRCGWDQVQIVATGIFGFLGHVFLVLGIQSEAAGIYSIMKASFDIIIAMIFQVIFFGVIPDLYNIGGAILVLVSITIICIRTWLLSLPNDAKARILFRYLI